RAIIAFANMLGAPKDIFDVAPRYKALFQSIGLTAAAVFTDPRILVWRSITERQNATLDIELPGGQSLRLHVKRYLPARGYTTPAQDEALGIRALEIEGI